MTVKDGSSPIAAEVDDHLIGEALARLDLAAKVQLLTGADFWNLRPAPGAGLRSIVLSDGPCGAKGASADRMETATGLPSPTAFAASWDEALVRELANLLAKECRDKGIDVLLAPMLNLHRSPLGGRHFEAFSEDPLLTGRLGVAFVRGLQERGVGACIKHFVCNDAETERRDVSNEVAERPLHELYLAPFERAVREAAPWSAMSAYNWVNGVPMSQNPLLSEPLKGAWGFDGMVTSDWIGTYTTEESGRGELDLVMPGPEGPWGDALLQAVRDGRVPEAAIDAKVRRILRLGARVGALNGATAAVPVQAARAGFDTTEARALARRVSVAGSVLLRNDGTLPMDLAAVRRIAVLGDGLDAPAAQGGGSSQTRPERSVSPLAGIRAALPAGVELLFLPSDLHRHGLETLTPAETRLPPAAGPRAGEPGVLARVLDEQGVERLREFRPDGEVVWTGDPALEGPVVVEVATQVVSDVSGRHRLGVTANADVAIWIDGVQVVDRPLPDASRASKWPWDDSVIASAETDLVAGRPVDVLVRAHKYFHRSLMIVNLGLERPIPPAEERLLAAAGLAAEADVAVVLVGTTVADESEGRDRKTLSLPDGQDQLVSRVAAANPRTVVVVSAGSPVLMPWRDQVTAILLTWFPGQEGGHALADLLFGLAEPGGRLPTTWPVRTEDEPVLSTVPTNGALAYTEGLFIGYRGWQRAGTEPAFAFGHGLGYTDWEYVSATPKPVTDGSDPVVTVTLRNRGARRGREVVQLYLSRPGSSVERPTRWLGGWAFAVADAGHEVEVDVTVDRWALRHWDIGAHEWATEPGQFQVSIGRSVADLRLSATVRV